MINPGPKTKESPESPRYANEYLLPAAALDRSLQSLALVKKNYKRDTVLREPIPDNQHRITPNSPNGAILCMHY